MADNKVRDGPPRGVGGRVPVPGVSHKRVGGIDTHRGFLRGVCHCRYSHQGEKQLADIIHESLWGMLIVVAKLWLQVVVMCGTCFRGGCLYHWIHSPFFAIVIITDGARAHPDMLCLVYALFFRACLAAKLLVSQLPNRELY